MQEFSIVINYCKKFETILEREYQAKGRGLHEKISSIQECLNDQLIKDLRFVATIRNKALHEANYNLIDDFDELIRRCNSIGKELQILPQIEVANVPLNYTPENISLLNTTNKQDASTLSIAQSNINRARDEKSVVGINFDANLIAEQKTKLRKKISKYLTKFCNDKISKKSPFLTFNCNDYYIQVLGDPKNNSAPLIEASFTEPTILEERILQIEQMKQLGWKTTPGSWYYINYAKNYEISHETIETLSSEFADIFQLIFKISPRDDLTTEYVML